MLDMNNFVIDLLMAKPGVNWEVRKLSRMVEDFSSSPYCGNFYNERSVTVKKLQMLQKQIEFFAQNPALHNNSLVAVGGLCGSGKSSFINSFFTTDEDKLPQSVNPCTAIPTYIAAGGKPQSWGFPSKGGQVQISDSLFQHFTLSEIKEFDVDLRTLLSFISVQLPLEPILNGICFLDIPSYDPLFSSDEDKSMLISSIDASQALIWVVDASAGGFKKSELKILIDIMGSSSRKLFVLCNKADLKDDLELSGICQKIEEDLDSVGLSCSGIQPYCSTKKYSDQNPNYFDLGIGASLSDFLTEIGVSLQPKEFFPKKIDSILFEYGQVIEEKMKEEQLIMDGMSAVVELLEDFQSEENIEFFSQDTIEEIDDSVGILENTIEICTSRLGSPKSFFSSIFEEMRDAIISLFDSFVKEDSTSLSTIVSRPLEWRPYLTDMVRQDLIKIDVIINRYLKYVDDSEAFDTNYYNDDWFGFSNCPLASHRLEDNIDNLDIERGFYDNIVCKRRIGDVSFSEYKNKQGMGLSNDLVRNNYFDYLFEEKFKRSDEYISSNFDEINLSLGEKRILAFFKDLVKLCFLPEAGSSVSIYASDAYSLLSAPDYFIKKILSKEELAHMYIGRIHDLVKAELQSIKAEMKSIYLSSEVDQEDAV